MPQPARDLDRGGRCRAAAARLRHYLKANHVRPDGALVGPDSGTRFNLRIWRFLKSYGRFLSWHDDRYYVQCQAYWIVGNAAQHAIEGDEDCRLDVQRCADTVLAQQTGAGHWVLSNPEWAGRITTVETCFGGLALIAARDLLGDPRYLEAAQRAYNYLEEQTGFKRYDAESICVNYFSNHPSGLVPNNATLSLWFFAELARVTNDRRYLEHCQETVHFVAKTQLESGELPYALQVQRRDVIADRPHYLCYQYNAFEFMDLAYYFRLTGDLQIRPVLDRLARFLKQGITTDGDARFNCFRNQPTMHYFTAAVAAALLIADELGLGPYEELAGKAYDRLLSRQRPNGSFDYSVNDYGFLADRRPYSRNLAMIFRHLHVAARHAWKPVDAV